jgi:hypothetical protein
MDGTVVMSESYINETRGYIIHDSGWYEPYTDDIGRLYKSCQQEYGRCISHVYFDTTNGIVPVGWVFQKRVDYTDKGSYLQSVWVSVGYRDADNDVLPVDVKKHMVPAIGARL